MLPRMNKNAVKIMLDKEDDAEDIQNKKKEAHLKMMGANFNSPKQINENQSLFVPSLQSQPNFLPNQSAYNFPQSKKVEETNKVKKFTINA